MISVGVPIMSNCFLWLASWRGPEEVSGILGARDADDGSGGCKDPSDRRSESLGAGEEIR